MDEERTETAVIGAGVAGLSLGLLLEGRDFRVFEKEPDAGGCLRQGGGGAFSFDVGARCVHDRHPEVNAFLEEVLGEDAFLRGRIRASFLYRGGLHPMPFELNLSLLPWRERLACLARMLPRVRVSRDGDREWADFEEYALGAYGAAGARFLLPYAEKTWTAPAREIDPRGAAGKAAPPPAARQLLRGLWREPEEPGFSYLYPARGMRHLVASLAGRVGERLMPRSEVVRVDLRRRVLELAGGERWYYQNLVSTIPLPHLVSMVADVPPAVREAGERLRYNCMAAVAVELDGSTGIGEHYVLVPERRFAFRRLTFPAAFSPALAPAGGEVIVAEVNLAGRCPAPFRDGRAQRALVEECVRQLEESGLMRGCAVRSASLELLKPAMIVPDRHWAASLETARGFLEAHGVALCGRFAEWRDLNIDDTILAAMGVAGRILSRPGARSDMCCLP